MDNDAQGEVLLRFAKGQAQIDYALQSVPEQAVVWGYLGVDNIITAALLAKGVDATRNHQQKAQRFLEQFPQACHDVRRAPELSRYCTAWNDVRYGQRNADNSLRREVLDLALDIQGFCAAHIPGLLGLQPADFEARVDALSEEAREMKPCFPEDPGRWQQYQIDELERQAEVKGQSRLAAKSNPVLTDLSFNVSADRGSVREALEQREELGGLLVDMYRAFYETVCRLVEWEHARVGASGELSETQPQGVFDFNLVCTLSYRGLQFLEWSQSDEFGAEMKKALERLLQSGGSLGNE